MILADKIIKERKKLGLSQEELAEKMNISRQSVSKWESNQSLPEIDKILLMSSIFGVTTDYLLKDDIEVYEKREDIEVFENPPKTEAVENDGTESENIPPAPPPNEAETPKVRTVSLQDAETFLSLRKSASRKIALGTFLCILSVIPLFLLTAASEIKGRGLSENTAAALGLAALFIIVSAAVAIFIYTGSKSSSYEFLEKEPFETENGVNDMVREQMSRFNGTYTKFNILGSIFCILSPISLFVRFSQENDFFAIVSLCITLIVAGIGSVFFILAGVPHEAMQKLLKEGDYSEAAKKTNSIKGVVSAAYWLVVTAAYLLMLFLASGQRGYSWVIWPVAGVLFPVVLLICDAVQNRKNNN